MVTRGGSRVTLQTRSRGYLSMSHGMDVSPTGSGIVMAEVSRFGTGVDIGKGGLLAVGAAYGAMELRANTTTIPLMPHLTGWLSIAPGQTFNARAELRFISEFWENTAVDGGDSQTESSFLTGDTRIDLYAVPLIGTPATRSIPTVVGVRSDTNLDLGVGDTETLVAVPPGTASGDTLIAVVANQFGDYSEINPVQTGWTLMHSRGEGPLFFADVHMKIYMRTLTAAPPASYSFTNGLFAEGISAIISVRGAASINSVDGVSWYFSSNLSRWKFVEDQIAPSISLGGQRLIAVSYFVNEPWQSPVTQTPPSGMTTIADIPASGSTMHIATLASPPNPTLDRKFTPSQIPVFTGHSITAAILIPGQLV
jgi:hypothetical protein